MRIYTGTLERLCDCSSRGLTLVFLAFASLSLPVLSYPPLVSKVGSSQFQLRHKESGRTLHAKARLFDLGLRVIMIPILYYYFMPLGPSTGSRALGSGCVAQPERSCVCLEDACIKISQYAINPPQEHSKCAFPRNRSYRPLHHEGI